MLKHSLISQGNSGFVGDVFARESEGFVVLDDDFEHSPEGLDTLTEGSEVVPKLWTGVALGFSIVSTTSDRGAFIVRTALKHTKQDCFNATSREESKHCLLKKHVGVSGKSIFN